MCLKMPVKEKPTISSCHLFVLPPLVNTSVNMLQAYLFNFLSFQFCFFSLDLTAPAALSILLWQVSCPWTKVRP